MASPIGQSAIQRANQQASAGYLSPMPGGSVSYKPRQAIGSNVLGSAAPKATNPVGIFSPSGGGGGGTTTTTITPLQNYQGDILSDPQAVGAQGMFDARASSLAAARADAIQRAVISGGWTPDMSGSLSGYASDVTPQTLQAAAANPMSQKAQLDLQLSQANQNLPYDLASSGAGRSGANAIQQGALQRQYQTASYQGQQDLLSSIYGAGNTYAGSYNDAMSQLMYAREQVANRLAQTAGYSQSISTDDGGGGGGDNSDYYSNVTIPSVVQKVIAQIGSKPVAANPSGATTSRGRGVISIH